MAIRVAATEVMHDIKVFLRLPQGPIEDAVEHDVAEVNEQRRNGMLGGIVRLQWPTSLTVSFAE